MLNRCPPEEVLQEFAVHPSNPQTARHLGDCSRCLSRVEEITRDNRLIDALRQMRMDSLTHNERERIVALCMQIANESEPR